MGKPPSSAPEPVRLLYVSTLDAIISVMLPHLDAAKARGWQVEVACQETKFHDDVAPHVDRIHNLPFRRFPLHPANVIALLRLRRLIRSGRYTIVHSHNPTGGFVGRLAATLAGVGSRRVYTAHGFHFHALGSKASNLVYRLAETFAGRLLSDAVLVINREDYDNALQGGVVKKDRLFLTGGVGVSARDDFNPARLAPETPARIRGELNVPDDAPLLLMVGEMIPRKRHADALQAFAHLREQYPNAVLALAGDGALREELEAAAEDLGVAKGVRFLGFRRDIAELLAATDIFVFPSLQEGLPCAIQEALAMEVPVVAAHVRGCADMVDETCGRTFPAKNIAALTEAIASLIEAGAKERRALGRSGRARMLEKYDRMACVKEWQAIYDTLLHPDERPLKNRAETG